MTRSQCVSAALTVLAVPLAAVGAALLTIGHDDGQDWGFALQALLGAMSLALSWIVVRRKPDSPVGAILACVGFVPFLVGAGDAYSAAGVRRPDLVGNPSWEVQGSQGLWTLLYLPVMYLMLLFPDGRLLPERRWRRVAYLIGIVAVVFGILAAGDGSRYNKPYGALSHPLGTFPAALKPLEFACVPILMVLLVFSAGAMVSRYRRSDVVVRAQVKWFALGSAALPLTLFACWTGYLVMGRPEWFVLPGLGLLYLGVPVFTAIALLRHNLYDVDKAISAAVLYGLITAMLLAVYSATSFAAGAVLGRDSSITGAAVTALVAVTLTPLKNRLKRRVDRRFHPTRQAALAAIDDLRHRVHAGQARPEQLEEVLRAAMRDPSVRVGYRSDSGFVDVSGTAVADGVAVGIDGHEIGVIASAWASRELLREVAAASALLVEVVALRLDLADALHEVESSRARIVHVGYAERRKLERDLHDGAQQRLVTLGMAIRLAQRHLHDGTVDVNGLMDQAVAELGTAVAELREIAHGLRPSSLDDGLGSAIRSLAANLPLPVEVAVEVDAQMPDDVATTAYYVAREAVANAVKYAQAERIGLSVAAEGERLRVRISDDGRGGAVTRQGSGLAGLADRVAALGGSLLVHSPAGAGTVVEAVLPCAS